MRAIVLCEERINNILDRSIFKRFTPEDSLIITTENSLFREIQEKYPKWKCKFIDIYSNDGFKQSNEITNKLIDQIIERLKDKETKSIADISINSVYEVYTRAIVQVEKQIYDLKEEYGFQEINLFGGNKKVPYFPLNMAEGEQPFRFMYKRSWFLNPVIYGLFVGTMKIYWKQELPISLYLKQKLRLYIFNTGKLYKIFRKHSKAQRSKNDLTKNDCIGIVVRTKNQLDSVLTIYDAIETKTRYFPLLLVYENYSNNELIKEINDRNLRYIDIRFYTSSGEALKSILRTSVCERKKGRKIIIYKNIEIDSAYISKEMKFQWWDAQLLINSFNKAIKAEDINIVCVVNIETYNWVAAAQAKWAKGRKLPIYSIQFVSLEICPHMIWADKYYFMTLDEKKKYKDYLADDQCGYVGPVCYDNVFNSSKHCLGELNKVVILTQPDILRNDSIRMIDDVLSIRDEIGENFEICIKLHPRESGEKFFRERYGGITKVRVVLNEENSTQLLIRADLAIGIVSTTLYQSVIIGTPAVSVNYDNLISYNLNVVEEGVVKKVINTDELRSCIMKYKSYEKVYFNNRKDYLKRTLGNYCGKGAEELASIIEKEIG